MKNAEAPYSKTIGKLFNKWSTEGTADMWEFHQALSEHDNELISEIEKKIKENQKKADTAISGNAIFFYDTKVIALTETINLIKEK